MKKILQIRPSGLKNLYVLLLCGVAQTAMIDKIIYGFKEINQMEEFFNEVRGLESYY